MHSLYVDPTDFFHHAIFKVCINLYYMDEINPFYLFFLEQLSFLFDGSNEGDLGLAKARHAWTAYTH